MRGQARLGDLCWSQAAGVVTEGCQLGTLCQPWSIGRVRLDHMYFRNFVSSSGQGLSQSLSLVQLWVRPENFKQVVLHLLDLKMVNYFAALGFREPGMVSRHGFVWLPPD